MRSVVLAVAAAAVLAAIAHAAQFQRGRLRPEPVIPPNPPYDGQFTFARLKFTSRPGGNYRNGFPPWGHEFPLAEMNLVQIMSEVTNVAAHRTGTAAVAVDDPALFTYPIGYMTEAGFWAATDTEVAAVRAYLRKGGFLIFDDFRTQRDWAEFSATMARVLPGARFIDLDPSQPIFHTFFEISGIDKLPQYHDYGHPILRGLFEDNDPKKRLMAMVNFNTDISDYWQYASTGFRPIEESNEGYKLGVNYVIYGMTH